jgi:hypothetical protein
MRNPQSETTPAVVSPHGTKSSPLPRPKKLPRTINHESLDLPHTRIANPTTAQLPKYPGPTGWKNSPSAGRRREMRLYDNSIGQLGIDPGYLCICDAVAAQRGQRRQRGQRGEASCTEPHRIILYRIVSYHIVSYQSPTANSDFPSVCHGRVFIPAIFFLLSSTSNPIQSYSACRP